VVDKVGISCMENIIQLIIRLLVSAVFSAVGFKESDSE
jgi:hypothetical protein